MLTVSIADTSLPADQPASQALFTWGLNSRHGRLGHSLARPAGAGPSPAPAPAPSAYLPVEVQLPLKQLGLDPSGQGWKIGEAECGLDNLWVELVEGEDE